MDAMDDCLFITPHLERKRESWRTSEIMIGPGSIECIQEIKIEVYNRYIQAFNEIILQSSIHIKLELLEKINNVVDSLEGMEIISIYPKKIVIGDFTFSHDVNPPELQEILVNGTTSLFNSFLSWIKGSHEVNRNDVLVKYQELKKSHFKVLRDMHSMLIDGNSLYGLTPNSKELVDLALFTKQLSQIWALVKKMMQLVDHEKIRFRFPVILFDFINDVMYFLKYSLKSFHNGNIGFFQDDTTMLTLIQERKSECEKCLEKPDTMMNPVVFKRIAGYCTEILLVSEKNT